MSVHRLIAARAASKALPWQDVTFLNSWFNYAAGFQTVQYRLVGDMVQVRGLARKDSAGAANESIFQLPSGLRPPSREFFPCIASGFGGASNTAIRVNVASDGTVYPTDAPVAGTNWVSLHFAFSITA